MPCPLHNAGDDGGERTPPSTSLRLFDLVEVHLLRCPASWIRTLRAVEVRTWLARVASECQCCKRAPQRVGGELRLVKPKTLATGGTVPLPPIVVKALTEIRERQGQGRTTAGRDWKENGLVFASRIGTPPEPDDLRRSWYPFRKRLGLEIRFHDLRHSAVSLLLDLGVPPQVSGRRSIVRQIVGHSDIGVTMKVYAHASLDEQRKALRKLGDTLS